MPNPWGRPSDDEPSEKNLSSLCDLPTVHDSNAALYPPINSTKQSLCGTCNHPTSNHDHYDRCFYHDNVTSSPCNNAAATPDLCRCGWYK